MILILIGIVEVKMVTFRLYGPLKNIANVEDKLYFLKSRLVENSAIAGILSEKQIGKKIYGLFPEGRIEEYIEVIALFNF